MPLYIIHYNAGFGDEYLVEECDSLEDAEKYAYESWQEAVESNAVYSAKEWTQEEADNLGL